MNRVSREGGDSRAIPYSLCGADLLGVRVGSCIYVRRAFTVVSRTGCMRFG